MSIFNIIDDLFDEYTSNILSDDDLIFIVNEYTENKYKNLNDLVKDYMSFSLSSKDFRHLENVITMIDPYNVDAPLLDMLHSSLLEDWHSWHEDIVFIIQKNNDKSSLNFLYQSLQKKYTEHNHNNHYSLHKKIVCTIYLIDGINCKTKLSSMERFISKDFKREFKQFLLNMK